MLTSDTTDEISVNDLQELSALEATFVVQREYQALEQEMKIVRARRQFARDRLIAELEGRGSTKDGNDHGTASIIKKTYPKVTNFEALKEYVYNLGEPISKYMKEVFIKGNKRQGIDDPLEGLIAKAFKQSVDESKQIQDCMPPGLAVTTDTQLRVTLKKQRENELFKAELENPYAALDAELEE